jgi:hypothetical protein
MKPSFYGSLRAQGYDIGTDVSSHMTFYKDEGIVYSCQKTG